MSHESPEITPRGPYQLVNIEELIAEIDDKFSHDIEFLAQLEAKARRCGVFNSSNDVEVARLAGKIEGYKNQRENAIAAIRHAAETAIRSEMPRQDDPQPSGEDTPWRVVEGTEVVTDSLTFTDANGVEWTLCKWRKEPGGELRLHACEADLRAALPEGYALVELLGEVPTPKQLREMVNDPLNDDDGLLGVFYAGLAAGRAEREAREREPSNVIPPSSFELREIQYHGERGKPADAKEDEGRRALYMAGVVAGERESEVWRLAAARTKVRLEEMTAERDEANTRAEAAETRVAELETERDRWKSAAESQNRQWSAKCTELTEMRARAEAAEKRAGELSDRVLVLDQEVIATQAELAATKAKLAEVERERARMAARSRGRCVRAFHEKYSHPIARVPAVPPDDVVRFRLKLAAEEFLELLDAALYAKGAVAGCSYASCRELVRCQLNLLIEQFPLDVDMVETQDALTDMDYVNEGMRVVFGVDGEPLFAEVHRSNMEKLPAQGPNTKPSKPPGWTPPDIAGELRKQGWEG